MHSRWISLYYIQVLLFSIWFLRVLVWILRFMYIKIGERWFLSCMDIYAEVTLCSGAAHINSRAVIPPFIERVQLICLVCLAQPIQDVLNRGSRCPAQEICFRHVPWYQNIQCFSDSLWYLWYTHSDIVMVFYLVALWTRNFTENTWMSILHIIYVLIVRLDSRFWCICNIGYLSSFLHIV